MNRRDIMKNLTCLPLALGAGHLFAAPATTTRLLVVFLRGGYDAASLLVPVSSSYYYETRPDIAVPRPSAELTTAIRLNSDWGLHPALRDTVFPLFQQGEAAFIPFAGTDDISRSHFETQDSIELGQPPGGKKDYRSGFLNRLASVLGSTQAAISFTDQLPLILQGQVQVPNSALKSIAKPSVDARQSAIIASMYKGTALAPQVSEGFFVRDEVMRQLADEMDAASRNAPTAKGFELEARRIARLMKERYNLGFIDVGGWDTHVNQGGALGYLASRLDELGHGLAAFAQEMSGQWRDTTVVVISEFGRTFRQNGNRGTDHGHGTVFWILGGGVRGGRIAGEQVRVEQSTLFQNRDYPVLNEYRSVLAGLFSRQYGMSSAQLDKVFAGVKMQDIGLA
jgi:uncharacterized protein (DUF1501 family)